MTDLARVVRMHASLLTRAAARRDSALRLRDADPERAEMAAEEAVEALEDARAIRELLRGTEVIIPDEASLSLLADGGIR